MSRLPYYLEGARWGYRLGNQELVDGMYRDGFFCPLAKMLMGETAETLAVQYKITREEQDRFALVSQQHAATAQSSGRFDAEIAPVKIEGKKEQPFSLVTNTCFSTQRRRRWRSYRRCFPKPARLLPGTPPASPMARRR